MLARSTKKIDAQGIFAGFDNFVSWVRINYGEVASYIILCSNTVENK